MTTTSSKEFRLSDESHDDMQSVFVLENATTQNNPSSNYLYVIGSIFVVILIVFCGYFDLSLFNDIQMYPIIVSRTILSTSTSPELPE